MTTALLLLSLLSPAAPQLTVELPAYVLDCSRGDTDAETDECSPDYVLGAESDGYQLATTLTE